MDARACKKANGQWNSRKKECMLRFRVQRKDKGWGYATGYHVTAKSATDAKKKIAERYDRNIKNLMAKQLGWPP